MIQQQELVNILLNEVFDKCNNQNNVKVENKLKNYSIFKLTRISNKKTSDRGCWTCGGKHLQNQYLLNKEQTKDTIITTPNLGILSINHSKVLKFINFILSRPGENIEAFDKRVGRKV